jgi:hypothetical protein
VVVQPPAHVLGPGLAAVAPPRVLLGLRVERAEHVDQPPSPAAGHPGAFLGQEAAVLLVAAPVLQVDGLVRDVDVAHQDELALGLQRIRCGYRRARKRNLAAWRSSPLEPLGK